MDRKVTAGKVGGLFGNKGELTLVLYDSFPRDPDREEPVFVEIDGHAVPLFFDSFVRRGVRGATAVFADIDTPVRAAELTGHEFFFRRAGGGRSSEAGGRSGEAGEGSDELYFEDLVGWEVQVGNGRTGRITAFFDSDLNPLLEVELEGGGGDGGALNVASGTRAVAAGTKVLIPAVEEFIQDIDESRHQITLLLPEGLLELNS
ncbi:MAG: hypothetical protein LBV38_04450 [Alistipes sp.]|nr:hypothetical protein [Alistipes sp.]